ncbi:MAG: ABC transporter permease [Polaromonas sp.]
MKHRLPFSALLYIAVFGIICIAAVFAPVIGPYGETELVSDPWLSWNAQHLLGTDNLGRDMFTRLLYGTRNTIAIALAVAMLSFVLGVTMAFIAAVMGGWVDQMISRVVDVLMSIPTLIFALVMLSVLGTSVPVLILVMAILESTLFFRIARPLAVDVIACEYVETARLRGEGLWWFLRREILPNVAPTLVAEFGLRFSFSALFVSSLSFLGLGIQPPHADLGGLVRENVNAITFGLGVPLVPAVMIALVTISVNGIVDYFVHRYSIRAEVL